MPLLSAVKSVPCCRHILISALQSPTAARSAVGLAERQVCSESANRLTLAACRLFIESVEGRAYSCKQCKTQLAQADKVLSKVRSATGSEL